MLDLNDFSLFVHIVDRRGFTAASKFLGISKSRLSLRIKALESQLGVRLLQRTSRHFSVTEAGEEFYAHARAVLQAADEAEKSVQHRVSNASGTIRCTSAVATLEFALRDIVTSFLVRFPAINVTFHATSRLVDVVGEHYDIAIRAHHERLPDSSLIQRPLAPAPWFLLASPGYLRAHPTPSTPSELQCHATLSMLRSGSAPSWRLLHAHVPGEVFDVPLAPRLTTDDMGSLKCAAMADLGIVALPAYVCRDEMRTGALQRVLPDWTAGNSTITALMPSRQGMPLSVRAFLDHVTAELPALIALPLRGAGRDDA